MGSDQIKQCMELGGGRVRFLTWVIFNGMSKNVLLRFPIFTNESLIGCSDIIERV